MECNNCNSNLPDYPMESVENNERDEVVAHKKDAEDPWCSQTDYYCNPECFIEAMN